MTNFSAATRNVRISPRDPQIIGEEPTLESGYTLEKDDCLHNLLDKNDCMNRNNSNHSRKTYVKGLTQRTSIV